MARPPKLYLVTRDRRTDGVGWFSGPGSSHEEKVVLGAKGLAEELGMTLPYTRLLLRFNQFDAFTNEVMEAHTRCVTRTVVLPYTPEVTCGE